MNAETNSLVLKVESKSVLDAAKALDKLESQSIGAERATGKLAVTDKELTDALRKSERQISSTNKQLADARSKHERLNKQIDQGKTKSSLLTRQNKRNKESITALVAKVKDLEKGLQKATDASEKHESQLKSQEGATDGMTAGLGRAAKGALVLAASYISIRSAFEAGRFFLTAAADLETLETGFVSLTGSVASAKAQVGQLLEFSTSTPFQIEGIAQAARQLITAKGNANGLTDELRVLGDIAATSGSGIEELASIYTKAFNKGKLQAEELNQISERGIPIMRQLRDQLRETRGDANLTTNDVFEIASRGEIGFDQLKQAFIAFGSEGGFAFEAMQRQSETLNGRISTLKDTVKVAAGEIGGDLAEAFDVKGILADLTKVANTIRVLSEDDAERASKVSGVNGIFAEQVNALEKIKDLTEEIADREEKTKGAALGFVSIKEAIKNLSEGQFASEESLLQLAREDLAVQIKSLRVVEDKVGQLSDEERQLFQIKTEYDGINRELEDINNSLTETKTVRGGILGLGRKEVTTTRTATSAEQQRLDVLEQQRISLGGQINEYQKIVKAAQELSTIDATPKIAVPVELTEAFQDVKQGLRTATERIEQDFKAQEEAINAFREANRDESGKIDDKIQADIEAQLNRAENAREEALKRLEDQEKRKLEVLSRSIAKQKELESGGQVLAQASRFGFNGDPHQNFAATVNGSSSENLGNRDNILVEGVSVALSPELANDLDIDLKAGEFVEALIDGVWKQFRVDDTTARGLSSTAGGSRRIDFFDPSGGQINTDGQNIPVRRAGAGDTPVNDIDYNADFVALTDHLLQVEETYKTTYEKRLQVIRENTIEGSALRAQLEGEALEDFKEGQLEEQTAIQKTQEAKNKAVQDGINKRKEAEKKAQEEREQELENLKESVLDGFAVQTDSYSEEIDALEEFYNRRRDIVTQNTTATATEKKNILEQITREENEALDRIERERWARAVESTQTALGQIVDAQALFGKRGADIAKGAAIASATIDMARNAILGYQRGLEIPYIGHIAAPIFAATALAAGAAQIATIKSTNVGNFMSGGIVPGGSFTGDALTANVNSGEAILNQEQQSRLLNIANGASVPNNGQGGSGIMVNLYNLPGQTAEVKQSEDDPKRLEIIIREVDKALASNLQTGEGKFTPALAKRLPDLRKTA